MTDKLEKKVMFPVAGGYILAVSGGLDSVVLLDVFAKAARLRKYHLVVAHFDHGMRPDSAEDNEFVAGLAKKHKLPFESKKGRLGAASEAAARKARYQFLNSVAKKHQAKVVTAQHADDLVETIIFNRGRKSKAKPFANENVLRPFINIFKKNILAYAKAHKLQWREDPTNQDLHYARNFIRHVLLPYLELKEPKIKQKLIEH